MTPPPQTLRWYPYDLVILSVSCLLSRTLFTLDCRMYGLHTNRERGFYVVTTSPAEKGGLVFYIFECGQANQKRKVTLILRDPQRELAHVLYYGYRLSCTNAPFSELWQEVVTVRPLPRNRTLNPNVGPALISYPPPPSTVASLN